MSNFNRNCGQLLSSTSTRLLVWVVIVLLWDGALWPQVVPVVTREPAWRYQPSDPGAFGSVEARTLAEISFQDAYFDRYYGASDPLDGPQRYGFGMSGHHESDEDFPTGARDEVVLAHFSTWTAHLSSSRRSIYTTVNLQIDQVVTDKDGHMSKGSVTRLLVPGGTVRLPGTRRVIEHFIRKDDFPLEPNTEYLLFLDREPPTMPFLMYVQAWKVEQGSLVPVTEYQKWKVSHGRSVYGGKPVKAAVNALAAR